MSDFVSSGTTTTKTSSDIEIDGVPMPGLKLNGAGGGTQAAADAPFVDNGFHNASSFW